MMYQERLARDKVSPVPFIRGSLTGIEQANDLFALDEYPATLIPFGEEPANLPAVEFPLRR
jgi:hypothetical protein